MEIKEFGNCIKKLSEKIIKAMKFNTQGAFLGLAGFLIVYLIAGVGIIFVSGEGIALLLFDIVYIRLGLFLGVVAFILSGILFGIEDPKWH